MAMAPVALWQRGRKEKSKEAWVIDIPKVCVLNWSGAYSQTRNTLEN